MQILEIPDVPEAILEAAAEGELVVFVGAGISICLGCPTWDQLAESMLEHICSTRLGSEGSITYREREELRQIEKNPRRLLSICWNIMQDNSSLMPKEDEWRKILPISRQANIYDDLLEFRSAYITTNYDQNFAYGLLRKYGNEQAKSLNSEKPPEKDELRSIRGLYYYKRDDMTTSNLIPERVLYLHGSIEDPHSLIVTTRHYLDDYAPRAYRREFLDEIFERRTILFIGTSMGEYEILEYLKREKKPKHYMLYPIFTNTIELIKHYQAYFGELGINLVPFSIDKQGPRQVENIVKDWKSKIGSRAKPLPTIEGLGIIDRVNL